MNGDRVVCRHCLLPASVRDDVVRLSPNRWPLAAARWSDESWMLVCPNCSRRSRIASRRADMARAQ